MTYSNSLLVNLYVAGLYETVCFLGTTEATYVFIEDDEPRFINRWEHGTRMGTKIKCQEYSA